MTGAGGGIEASGGAREEHVVDSRGSLMEETAARLESLPVEERQASLAGSYPAFGSLVKHPYRMSRVGTTRREKAGSSRVSAPHVSPPQCLVLAQV